MPLERCDNGHYFDPGKHSACPSCGLGSLSDGRTRPKMETAPPAPAAAPGPAPAKAEPKTVPLVRREAGIDPVVGWLVCVAGPDRGRDYRIRAERNFLGRGEGMDIRIAGDETISRDRHAIVSYNPKNRQFKILPGEGRGIVYLNDDEVDSPRVLAAGDHVEIGRTRLLFVPLCGDGFDWRESDPDRPEEPS